MNPDDRLSLKYVHVSWAYERLLEKNGKLHDIGSICESICRYGFKEVPKYETSLNGGNGGIVAGNGRVEALWMLEQSWDDKTRPCPRGIAIEQDTDKWTMPILFGVDSESEAVARAYAIDSNNLTLMGGTFTAVDAKRMWEGDEYLEILHELAELNEMPVSVDGDDLDLLMSFDDAEDTDSDTEEAEQGGGGVDGDRYPVTAVLSWAEHEEWKAWKEAMGTRKDKDALLKAIRG